MGRNTFEALIQIGTYVLSLKNDFQANISYVEGQEFRLVV